MIAKIYNMNLFMISNLFAIITFFSCAQEQPISQIKNNKEEMENIKTDTAIFGAGCFWCVEAYFQQLDGVLKVTSGYSGGHVANPTYEQVSAKNTGHVEVANIVYDPSVISFDELLEVFWKTHDPTTVDQQGNDKGPQYRSVIFYHDNEQKEIAEKYKMALDKSGAWSDTIVTGIEPLKNFFDAEAYHQNYYNTNPAWVVLHICNTSDRD